jgi:hypothetical protein
VLHDGDAGGLPRLDRRVQLLDRRFFQTKRRLLCTELRCHAAVPLVSAHDTVMMKCVGSQRAIPCATLPHHGAPVQYAPKPRSTILRLAPRRCGAEVLYDAIRRPFTIDFSYLRCPIIPPILTRHLLHLSSPYRMPCADKYTSRGVVSCPLNMQRHFARPPC